MHQLTAFIYQFQAILHRDHPGGVQGTVFTQAVAGAYSRLYAGILDGCQTSQIHSCDRRLQIDGLGQLFHRTFKAQLGYGQARGTVRSVKYLFGRTDLLGQILAHPDFLRSLTWKQKSDIFQGISSFSFHFPVIFYAQVVVLLLWIYE
jgi:hypothetical protein